MKTSILLSLAAGSLAAPAPQGHSHGAPPPASGPAPAAQPGQPAAKASGGSPLASFMAGGKANPITFLNSLGIDLGMATWVMPALPRYKTTSSTPTSKRPGVIREQLYYGPLTLKPAAERMKEKPGMIQMDPAGNVFFHSIKDFPRDINILNTDTTIRDANGNVLGISQGVYNHHISIPDLSRPIQPLLMCANQVSADLPVNSFAGVGEDGGSKKFIAENAPGLSGYFVGQKDGIMLTTEIVNNKNVSQNVYVTIDVEYMKAKPELVSTWHVVGVGTCDGKGLEIHPEKGQKKFVIASKPMSFLRDGYIFGIRGHLHDGGVAVTMKINDKVICDSAAKYGGEGKTAGEWETISSMVYCAESTPITVNKGDVLTLETSYDFEKHPARQHSDGMMAEAMGLALFSYASRGKV